MDLLFQKYASPMDLMKLYIENGRFGEFVSEFIRLEVKHKKEKAEKEKDERLWNAYIHSYTEGSFEDYKNAVVGENPIDSKHTKEDILKDEKIQRLINRLG